MAQMVARASGLLTLSEIFIAQVSTGLAQGAIASTANNGGNVAGIFGGGIGATSNYQGPPLSSRSQTTDTTPVGTVQPDTPSAALQAQHQVTTPANVPGAGQ